MSDRAEGELVGRYRIVRRLGRGGVATTYEVEAIDGGGRFALKELRLAHVDDWKVVELFEREACVLANITHPAVPAYVDHFSIEGLNGPAFCLVQQLAPGRSLADLVASGWRADEAEAKRIAGVLLDVLDYLHARRPPVFHRDIKPLNVLREDGGKIWLVDFGAVRDVYRSTAAGSTMAGTVGYMAPEQLHGVARPETDLYGLGATLLTILSGLSPTEMPRRKLRLDFASHVPVSRAFSRWLGRMLEPAAEDRFPAARRALAALRELDSGDSSRIPWNWIAVVSVALVAGLAGSTAAMFHELRGRRSGDSASPRTSSAEQPVRIVTSGRASEPYTSQARVGCASGPVFVKQTPIPLGNAPYFVRVGDFNGDSHLDVAVPSLGVNRLNVLLGNGGGALTNAAGSPYPVGASPCSEAIGDFNRDGLADIAVMNKGTETVSMYMGQRSGLLVQASGSPVAVGGESTQSCGPAAGDFNSDGELDLVVPVDGTLHVLLGDGRGGFTSGRSTVVSGVLQAAVAADFNEDGRLDVVSPNFTGDVVNVFLGDGRGAFSTGPGSPWAVGAAAVAAAVGDFNGDGHSDLAVTGYDAGTLIVLLGDGTGRFRSAPGSPIFVGTNPTGVAVADFDGDGNQDLVAAVNGGGSLAILRGTGKGAFAAATGSPMRVGPYPGSVAVGDFNEDGRVDVALTNNIPGTWTVSLLLNTCVP
jgi:serine/threonine protein kinase